MGFEFEISAVLNEEMMPEDLIPFSLRAEGRYLIGNIPDNRALVAIEY